MGLSEAEQQVAAIVLEREVRPGTPTVLLELVRSSNQDPAASADPPTHTSAGGPREPSSLLPGMPHPMRFLLALLTRVLTGRESSFFPAEDPAVLQRGLALVRAAEAVLALGSWLDAVLVHLAREMADRAGADLLARDGLADPGDLSRTRRERWRQQTKSLVANELQAITGRGIQDCHDLVGFALAPAGATEAAFAAMESGRADWARVGRWWKRCRRMPVEDAADVARALFPARQPEEPSAGDPPSSADGGGGSRPSLAEFGRALDREATRVEGRDALAARRRRAEAVQARCAWAVFEEEGVGSLTVTGRTSTVAAAMDRIDAVARRARAAGDERTLDQLRSDAVLALLTHGVLPARGRRGARESPVTTGPSGRDGSPDQPAGPDVDPAARAARLACTAGDEDIDPAAGGGWEPAVTERLTAVLEGHAPASVEVIVPLDVLLGSNPDGVAEIVGRGFITGEHARELLSVPGSMLRRLVTDPLTGVALERSVERYTPDRAMRDLVTAVDQACRGPGCTTPARSCELDHVIEYPAGPTSANNLAAVHKRHHAMKTHRWWSAVMEPDSRRLRWTTFFGSVRVTKPHDYRQYDRPGPPPAPHSGRIPAAAGVAGGDGVDDVDTDVVATGADLRDRLFYAALAHRETAGYLAGYDDEVPDRHDDAGRSAVFRDRTAPVLLRHRTSGGALRRGAPPGQAHPRRIIERLTEYEALPAATLPGDEGVPAATLPGDEGVPAAALSGDEGVPEGALPVGGERGSGARSEPEHSGPPEPPEAPEPPPPPF
ncbi:MAG TPA: HNH endonuclease signature motif containing protein [Ornithinicoccus sp.]|nr:HNH endonuclease signature motif containing protein [Ornithinicoccus sp.]